MDLQREFDKTAGSLTLNGAGLPSFLLAVSGGVDSMTLATLFLGSALHLKFEVAHVNFSLRGAESDSDEEMVRGWCSKHGITLHVRRFDTAGYAAENGISIEMAARELRYGWFRSLMKERNLDLLAVAHNLNDNVETLCLNLLRGTGIRGAAGMQMLGNGIFRPLLKVSRSQIEAFAAKTGIEWHTDSTNLESEFARNRIRNEIFPQLERINPSFLQSVSASMEHFAQAGAVLDEEFQRKKEMLSHNEGDTILIGIDALAVEKHRRYWLFRLLEPFGFNASQINDVEASLDGDENTGKLFFSRDCTLVRDRQFLKIYPARESTAQYRTAICRASAGFDPKSLPEGSLCIDADLVKMPLQARIWQNGDRFRPFGMNGTKLVSDFLTGLKLDREQKRRQSVMTDAEGRIICICGLRIDDRFRITEKTKNILIIT